MHNESRDHNRAWAAVAALMSAVIAVVAGACASKAPTGSDATLADRPEPGLQGQNRPEDVQAGTLPQPYSKGVRVVGHSDVFGRDSNVQLAWSGHCAYIASSPPKFLGWGMKPNAEETSGVAVIDVSDAHHPKAVRLLREAGALYAAETMSAASSTDRKVLAAGAYSNGTGSASPNDKPAYVDIYDVSDCANPRLLSEFIWPQNAHTLTVSPNGHRVYGTSISPFTGKGGLMVLDISDLAHPRYLGKFDATRPDGTSFEFATHEISISADERRIYAGVIASAGGDLNPGVKLMPPSVDGLGPNAGGIYILDNSDIAAGRANPKMRLIGTSPRGGWHSVMQANINGTPYLVGGGELGACPASWPKISNIADEAHPFIAGEFKLQMNHAENCPPPTKVERESGGVVGSPGTASLHFNDVDSATDTRLGLFNFMWSGLRIADLRDPKNPVEVAYFKPGDACTGHVRYLPNTGDIWLTCAASGFYVIELTPSLRAALGMPKVHSR